MRRAALILALMVFPMLAQAGDFEITVERKKEGDARTKGGVFQKATQKWTGEVKILNHGFKPSPELQVRFLIFVKRQQLGQKYGADHIETVKGEEKIVALNPGKNTIFFTPEITLDRQQLDPNYFFLNGGREDARDTVTGVWVKLFDGTKEVGEYANPEGTKEKYKWKWE